MKTEQFDTYDDFYAAIPVDGSLGVLALGAAGLIAWRKKREKAGLPRAASFQPEPGKPETVDDGKE